MAAAAGGPSDVFVLDLDGVIVDSEPEVSVMYASSIAGHRCSTHEDLCAA